ncbi:MAG: DsrE family protein [Desulfovibrionaceae bacterium]
MNYNLLMHVDLDEPKRIHILVDNITNYLVALPDQDVQVAVVANGPAVKFFTKENCPVVEALEKLATQKVSFRICANALRKFQITPEQLLPQCTIVPAGILEIVRLQRENFAYIKP